MRTKFVTVRAVRSGVRHTVPTALVWQLVDLVKRWHVPQDELLAGSELSEATLNDAPERISVSAMCSLLQRARLLTGEAGLGYYLAIQTRVSMYGYIGFAAQSASSVREALAIGMQFAPVFSTALALSLTTEGATASLIFEERADFAEARDIVLLNMMLGLREVGRALTGQQIRGAIEFAIARPAYFQKFALFEPHCRFDRPSNRILFDAAVLDMPITLSDPAALRLARQMCERALDELGFDTDLGERVNQLLWTEDGRLQSLQEVAGRMRISSRTLKRRLAAQGLSFSALVDRERRTKALQLLRSSRLSIEEVAQALGYPSESNFARVFHRWTGKSPLAYRRSIWGTPTSRRRR